jgi:hypothetical protein
VHMTEREFVAEQLYNAWLEWHAEMVALGHKATGPSPPWDEARALWKEAFYRIADRAAELLKP